MNVAKYFAMGFIFMFLLTGAYLGLELMEGYSIRTSMYYGIHNLGFALIAVVFLASVIIYMVIMLPFSWLLGFIPWKRSVMTLYLLLYCVLWVAAGVWLFHQLYDPVYVKEYHLRIDTAIFIFGVMGLLYGWIEWLLIRRAAIKP
ncbi:hypothetical protein [Paenibacillus sp. Cedars]|uniref:hypothetical protein n=1 Tax=Paenibacillus sp. Cedars TaxID=1980674 RepID=UPI0011651AA2|nr:hypothetical protein [Paenibacillus sp. Cedars]AWP30460.1 hypothetical protein B9D94_29350 [Paenibacillus sp. Cedars]